MGFSLINQLFGGTPILGNLYLAIELAIHPRSALRARLVFRMPIWAKTLLPSIVHAVGLAQRKEWKVRLSIAFTLQQVNCPGNSSELRDTQLICCPGGFRRDSLSSCTWPLGLHVHSFHCCLRCLSKKLCGQNISNPGTLVNPENSWCVSMFIRHMMMCLHVFPQKIVCLN